MTFNVKDEAVVFCAARGISARGELALQALLHRARQDAVEATEEEIAAQFCSLCADGKPVEHTPDRERFQYSHKMLGLFTGCTADFIHERRRKREEPTDD
jgi:hypothetical protein